jgi:hypothetical protein
MEILLPWSTSRQYPDMCLEAEKSMENLSKKTAT